MYASILTYLLLPNVLLAEIDVFDCYIFNCCQRSEIQTSSENENVIRYRQMCPTSQM